MKTHAMVLREHGGPEVLVPEEVELGPLRPGHVRIRVRAVALNHLDLWVRRGLPNLRLEYPHRLGSDIAGEIAAVGDGTTPSLPFVPFVVGQRALVNPGLSCGTCLRCLSGKDMLCKAYRILGENTQGGYAEHIDVPTANLVPYPGDLPFSEAAAIPLVFLTAWEMLVEKARVGPGTVVLVQAAGSGVSSAAIQIAKLHGARVIATTGSDEKVTKALELGADHVINNRTHDFVKEVRRLTDKQGVDVVVEHVGGETFTQSILATARGGMVVTCGATSGFHPEIDLRQIFFRQVEVKGSTMGSKGHLFAIVRHVEEGSLRPVVGRVLPLNEVREAHRALEAREVFGKVVLVLD